MKHFFLIFILFTSGISNAQDRFSSQEIAINAFRNPSIGAEYRYHHVSVHAGYYPTNFESGVTTEFFRSGLTYWFLPMGKKENPSSFYGSVSYVRGFTRDYENRNGAMTEVGFRWMIYKGLNFRIGVAALFARDQSVKFNPTPGIGYSFFF